MPAWLPAAAALAALCALAIVVFGVLGGGEDGGGGTTPGKASESKREGTGSARDTTTGAGGEATTGAGGEATTGAGGGSADSGNGDQAGSGSAGGTTSGSPSSSGRTAGSGPSALNSQGFRLMNQGRYDEAVAVLQKAVAAYRDGSTELTYAFALYNLGRSLRLAGRPAEAVPILERRLRIPNQTATVRRELEAARRASG